MVCRNLPRFLKSLKLKLIFGASIVALAIFAITYLTLSHTSRRAASSLAEKQAGEVSSFFTDAIAESVAAGDRMQIHLLSRAILNKGVHAISVTSNKGNVLYSSHADLDQNDLFSAKDLKSKPWGLVATSRWEGEIYLHIAKPIHFSGTPLGMMHLWINRSELERRIEEANIYIYPILGLAFLLFVILGAVVLYTPFRVLRGMTLTAERIGAGDLSARVPVNGCDEVATFCEAFNTMAGSLGQAREEIFKKHMETIQAMVSTVEAKDKYTQGHCLRVRDYASKILQHYENLIPEEKRLIEKAALLHDIGKIGVTDRVLLKKSKLNEKDVKIIKSHVTIGENILRPVESMKEVASWIGHHHERWDGRGYPDGIKGESIPLASRVIAVADAIDAMRTERPYRKAFTMEKTIKILKEEKGKQFDPRLVEIAVSFLERQKNEDPHLEGSKCAEESLPEDFLLDSFCDDALHHHKLQLV